MCSEKISLRIVEIRPGTKAIMLKTATIVTLLVTMGSVIMITLFHPGSYGRIAMILTGVTGFFTCMAFFLQIRQKKPRD